MDNNYVPTTFEYHLSDSNANNDTSQFIVVQNDGTFLAVNDRPIQYITQVEDLTENIGDVQSSIIYDVTPQQYYVNVDNSSKLISGPDQFIMPDSENNMYTNNYLLQAVENNNVDQMEQEEFETNTSVQVNTEEEKERDDCKGNEMSDCTEIMLSVEQHQLLEQKGWILLETTDTVYLLDTLGLHDITADKKLIEKLKRDTAVSKDTSSNMVSEDVSYENEGHFVTTKMDYLTNEDLIEQQKQDVQSFLDNNPDPLQPEEIKENHTNDNAYFTAEHDYVKASSFKDTSYRREREALRIKTKFAFKDIPQEIVLGRTVHGRKLVARLRTENQKLKSALTNKAVGKKFQKVPDEEYEQHVSNDCGLDKGKLQYLIQENLWGNTDSLSIKDVTAAEIVVEQLLRVPAFKPTIMERRLIITKVVIDQYEIGQTCTSETLPTMVTGRVVKTGTKVVFKHIPDLLLRTLSTVQVGGTKVAENFVHIHIQEMKGVDGITRISIALNTQNIPLMDLAKNARNKQNMVYACGSCAAIYNTEEGLKLHLETDCMDVDNLVTIDADNSTNHYSAVFTDKGREYLCNQCHTIFKKLSICRKHVKNNCHSDTPDRNEGGGNRNVFNCKMCESTFRHAGSLSKHIVTKHIRINTK